MVSIKIYWHQSKSPFYSLIFTLPLLIGYEFLVFTLNHSDIMGLRNGADILFRQFFAIFGIYGFYFVGFIVLLALLLSYHFHTRKKNNGHFKVAYFLLMLFESMCYAFLLLLIVDQIGRYFILQGEAFDRRQLIALALGAGVYEEFIFRVVMITAALFLCRDILRFSLTFSVVIAILFSSLVFSLFHYMGPFGDPFKIQSFIMRFGAGVFLAILFTLRGYGITAYTHMIYDMLVIFML